MRDVSSVKGRTWSIGFGEFGCNLYMFGCIVISLVYGVEEVEYMVYFVGLDVMCVLRLYLYLFYEYIICMLGDYYLETASVKSCLYDIYLYKIILS